MWISQWVPVNDLPCVRQIPHYLHGNENFFFDIDGADHLVQELSGVSQELTNLQIGLQLMELLDLGYTEKKNFYITITIQAENKHLSYVQFLSLFDVPSKTS